MSIRTNRGGRTVEQDGRDLSAREVVWLGAPFTDGSTEPTYVRLFAAQEAAEQYVESLRETAESTREWTSWDEHEGRQLVAAGGEESVGIVSPVRTTVPGVEPTIEESILERTLSSDSRLRPYLPFVNDPPAIDREALPFTLLDLVLFSKRGHLQFQVGETSDIEAGRYRDELATFARKAVREASAGADDRIARSRIEELDSYFLVASDTTHYGKPRYRLAKRLSEWGGPTGRYASLELWLLFQLLLRLYPGDVSWEPGYAYHDDH